MKIFPDVGSMILLIIFIVVVLPHPEGPTKTTHSPAGIVKENSLTAAFSVFGYRFVKRSKRISCPIVDLDTKPPRCCKAADEDEHSIKN
ncbi:unannotated protein [freshwater metagenome]|uniref:Unannotated protein n=1 Tax=freshwater metagenome TaxID=449393 RepID=A0A6J6K4P9_9ZZZZ